MNPQRINGHRENLEAWTEQELSNAIDYANDRIEAAISDREKLIGELALRYGVVEMVGEVYEDR